MEHNSKFIKYNKWNQHNSFQVHNLQFKDLSSMLKLWNNQCGGEKEKEDGGAYAQKKKKTNQKKQKMECTKWWNLSTREEDCEIHGQKNLRTQINTWVKKLKFFI